MTEWLEQNGFIPVPTPSLTDDDIKVLNIILGEPCEEETMRLIDGDDAIRKIMDEMQRLLEEQSRFSGKSTGMVNNIRNTRYGLAKALDILTEQPTLEERKTGKWKPDRDNERDWYCSECDYLGNRWFKYCPNCGSYNGGET